MRKTYDKAFVKNIHPETRIYKKDAAAARFLLGGIGTGNISIDNRGGFCDFELFNKPAKGEDSPYTFFAVRTEEPSGRVQLKALEGQFQPPFDTSHGAHAWQSKALSRFSHSEMTGEYPFVSVTLRDPSMPVAVQLEAFTPFVPLNADDSSLPGAILRYRVHNETDAPITASVAGSFANLCNFTGRDIWTKPLFEGVSVNEFIDDGTLNGLRFSTGSANDEDPGYMDMALMTGERTGVTSLPYWAEGAWWDGLQDFWNDFSEDGELSAGRALPPSKNVGHVSPLTIGSLCVKKEIAPRDTAVFEFILTWYVPNRLKSWSQECDCQCSPGDDCCLPKEIIGNYYAKHGPSLVTARRLYDDMDRLEDLSRAFRRALFLSSYPEPVIDAIASNITVIRSTTCFRVSDGTFYAWEGCFDGAGCCDGNCSHVWDYAQTLAFLFPELERNMRRTDFLVESEQDGRMYFRAMQALTGEKHDMPPAADGQLGSVVRAYREWKISGDDQFLFELWVPIKRCLEFAARAWDSDGDGMLDSQQHNTYDIEFYGPNSLVNSIYFAALRAAAEMAEYQNEPDLARAYRERAERGAKLLDAATFNGEYYVQKIDDVNSYKYQYGAGCLSDQLLGQQFAHINGLGYLLPRDHVKSAVHAIFAHNFKRNMEAHNGLQRTYALNDEAGLLLCTWPDGQRPALPFVYCDEVWTGIEYQVATHLIYEGFLDEGLEIVRAVRNRQDGVRRSPWNEVECGHHYARSLASYGLLLSLSGLSVDLPRKKITFRPAMADTQFRTFFTWGTGWGELIAQKNVESGEWMSECRVLSGSLDGITVTVTGK